MKVCVTAGAEGLDAPIDLRFGRSPFFVLVDTESMAAESVPNTSASATGGAISLSRLADSLSLTPFCKVLYNVNSDYTRYYE